MTQPSPDAKAVVRAADALTTQVRRIANALTPPVAVIRDGVMTPLDDASRHATIAAALTSEHYRLAEAGIVASPEDHCAAMASAVMRVLPAAAPTPDSSGPLAGRIEVRDPCPYCGDRQMIPRHQFAEHVARLHPDVRTGGPEVRPAQHGIRSLLEHVGIDTTGRDISVAGRVVDPAPTPSADEDDEPAACWHTEPNTPCDWDICRQPERLAAGDRGTDPAHTPPLGPALRARAAEQHAADEDTLRFHRRESLLVLLTRLQRGRTLTEDEATSLRQHVETEMREANTARAEARRLGLMVDEYSAGARQLSETLRREKVRADAAIERETTAEDAAEQQRAAIERVRARCQAVRVRVGSGGMINATQILGLLSLTWPDGNYEAPAPGAALDEPAREPGIVVHPERNRQVSKPSWVDEGPPSAQNHVRDRLAPALDGTEQPTITKEN